MTIATLPVEDYGATIISGDWVVSGDAIRSNPALTDNRDSETIFDLFGALPEGNNIAKVFFSYRVSSEDGYDKLKIIGPDIDVEITGETDWAEHSALLYRGQTFTLNYAKDRSNSAGEDAGFVGQIRYEAYSEFPYHANIAMVSGDWVADAADGSIRSKDITDSESTTVTLDLFSYGESDYTAIHLEIFVSTEEEYDKVFIVGASSQEFSGNLGWIYPKVIPDDDGLLTITYQKDVSNSKNADYSRIDNVIFVKGAEGAAPIAYYTVSMLDTLPPLGFYPEPAPRLPNPTAIKHSGRSNVLGVARATNQIGHIDQIDGSGANGTPTGGVSDPARMGVIAGTVLDIQAQPVSRRVRVHERATGRIVRETWSGADGKYRFTDLDPRIAFYVMAFDHTLQQNAVVSDNVHSEVEDRP
ncbi:MULTISPECIES: carboxypeptidase-like regulatory domain-containing protein [Cobetia]|uniref:carboxypeptidase-like regulatory domain-containing protein n=1 Tax=Cobetia TaxID=204286 RepID=UPI00158419D4|nr:MULTISPECIES: carboxypeptidase-like regulatory domain-containing protein [Cobetia]MDI4659566.1 carboxypeptidase-like regulatory domain-containing protein [Cobetia sp. BMC6]NUJ56114.1 carboxypeptidase regulatory-like domain-containing protein [Cobetia marina]